MPIRAISTPAVEQLHTPITILDNSSIAIDGFWYIKKYMNGLNNDFVGNPSLALSNFLQPLIKLSEKTQIIFIWDGLKHKPGRVFTKEDISNKMFLGISRNDIRIFDEEILVKPVTNILNQIKNITVIRAPYSATAQCVYFLKNNCVKFIFAKNDAILFDGCSNVITELDLSIKKLASINKEEIIKSFVDNLISKNNSYSSVPFSNLKRLFKYFAISSGCDFCYTIPIFAYNFSADVLLNLFSDSDLFEEELEKNKDYYKMYNNALVNIKFHPIMSLEGNIQLFTLNEDDSIPMELKEVFGEFLPEFYYEMLFKCLISPILLNEMAFNKKVEKNNSYSIEVPTEFNFKKFILSKVELFVNKSIKVNGIYANEILTNILGLNLIHKPEINKLIEILFLIFVENKQLETNQLTNLLNSGIETKISLGIENAVKSVLPDRGVDFNDVLTYLKSSEALILLEDFIEIIHNFCQCEKDIEFNFSISKLLKKHDYGIISEFLKQNLQANVGLAEFL